MQLVNNGQCKMWSVYSVELVLAQNFHSKANPTIDDAASYFTKSSTPSLASYVAS